jgi:membrane protease subunit HflC
MNRALMGGAIALALAVLIGAASLFTVEQTEQVLITQFGQPIRVISSPGLHAKVPFIQTVISFDRRLLDFESVGEEVILADQRRLIVDSFTRFRITDPLRYFQAVGPQENGIRARLNSVVTSSLRRVLGNETLLNVLSNERARIMGRTKTQVSEEMKGFGIAIEDVRLRRADLPEENTQAILGRMKSERERVASQLRAEGAEASLKIRADADRDRTVLLAEARANADKLRGDGERQAIKIYADAFQQDPAFYETYRTLQAYREAFGAGSGANGGSRLVLTPDVDFLKLLREAPKP